MAWPKNNVTREVWITTLEAFAQWLASEDFSQIVDEPTPLELAEAWTTQCEIAEANREHRLAKGRLG